MKFTVGCVVVLVAAIVVGSVVAIVVVLFNTSNLVGSMLSGAAVVERFCRSTPDVSRQKHAKYTDNEFMVIFTLIQ